MTGVQTDKRAKIVCDVCRQTYGWTVKERNKKERKGSDVKKENNEKLVKKKEKPVNEGKVERKKGSYYEWMEEWKRKIL